MSWTNELAQEISGRVLTDDAARDAVATDFGRIVVRRPQVVVCPASAEDVARVVKFAARNSLHGGDARRWALANRAIAFRPDRTGHDLARPGYERP